MSKEADEKVRKILEDYWDRKKTLSTEELEKEKEEMEKMFGWMIHFGPDDLNEYK